MSKTLFERIAAGEIPCHKVWESEAFLAFLDIRPVSPGHTLVIPKKAYDPLWEMPEADYLSLCKAAREVAILLKKRLGCLRVCSAVIGYEVSHVHIHLVPTSSIEDFPWPSAKVASQDELAQMAQKLRQ